MIKKVLFHMVAASLLSASAVEVANESALGTALSGADKNITITSSFTTTKNIIIPEGYVVTLANGVKLTIGSYKGGLFNLTTYYYDISGAGVLVTKNYKVITDSTRTLPTVADSVNRFSGATYYVTKVIYSGGSVSRSVTCKQKTSVTVENAEVVPLNFDPAAVVCNVSSGINGGRTFVAAYASMLDACKAVKTDGSQVVILLKNGSMTVDAGKEWSTGFVLDCAGFNGEFSSGGWGLFESKGQVNNKACLVYLNAGIAKCPKLTNAGACFINCSNMTVDDEFNNNGAEKTTYVHVYDAESLPSLNLSNSDVLTGKSSGICFFSGGPYPSMSDMEDVYKKNCHIYGGRYSFDPSSYVPEGFNLVVKPIAKLEWEVVVEVAECVAKIGSEEYYSVQSAIESAKSGDTVVLQKDVSISEPIVIASGQDLVIDLGGYSISAATGCIVNNGTLTIVNSTTIKSYASLSTESGALIVNNGSLEIAFGTYTGNILLNGGCMTVHHGIFTGDILFGEDVVDTSSCVDLRGGAYIKSVGAFLKNGYIETSKTADSYKYVGKYPYAIVADVSMSGYEKAWKIEALPPEDKELMYRSSSRSDFSMAEWFRLAELVSMYEPYNGFVVDLVIKFNRSIKAGGIKAGSNVTSAQSLGRDLAADEIYRALSENITMTQIDYARFLSGEWSPLSAGIKNLSDENAGTVCTIEFQLCHTDSATKELVTDYILASASYRFPWKDAIPELREDDTPETVASALEGTADAKVAKNIKGVASYNSYRQWTAGVKGATAADVKAAPNAWLSYALNTTNLVETPLEGDMSVASISPAAEDGVFKLSIAVKDIDIGTGNVSDEQMQENLAKVFGIEGSTSLDSNSFSRDNVVYTLGAPADGKVTVEARPAVASQAGCFFMRAKMTP